MKLGNLDTNATFAYYLLPKLQKSLNSGLLLKQLGERIPEFSSYYHTIRMRALMPRYQHTCI